jgi:molecular chaperone GrpE (heat shock protein)
MKRRSAGNDETTDRPGAPVVDVPPEEAGLTPAEPGAGEVGTELDSLRAERDELKDRVLRRAAEFDN